MRAPRQKGLPVVAFRLLVKFSFWVMVAFFGLDGLVSMLEYWMPGYDVFHTMDNLFWRFGQGFLALTLLSFLLATCVGEYKGP